MIDPYWDGACAKCLKWEPGVQNCKNEDSPRFQERTMGYESCEHFMDYDEDRNNDK